MFRIFAESLRSQSHGNKRFLLCSEMMKRETLLIFRAFLFTNINFFEMEFLEKELEQIIWESSEEQLENAGLNLEGRRFRQFKIGNYGIADLVTVDRRTVWDERYYDENKLVFIDSYLIITVYELKQKNIGISAFLQALNYIKGISRYLKQRKITNVVFNLVLIGNKLDTSGSFCFLPDLVGFHRPDADFLDEKGRIERVCFYTYKMNIDGLKFINHDGFSLTNEGF